MQSFSTLVFQASQAFGAPAYLASALGCAPHDVYRWIAGTADPGPEERRSLELRLQGALEQRAAAPAGSRRWNDESPAFL